MKKFKNHRILLQWSAWTTIFYFLITYFIDKPGLVKSLVSSAVFLGIALLIGWFLFTEHSNKEI